MALTMNSAPQNIDNTSLFSIVTSLSEDATHVNLRVRADLYHEGIIKATVEKPKGIADFNFDDILKSLTPGLLFARDSGDIVKTGTVGSNLLTSWAAGIGTFDTLTTSGNSITSAIEASGDSTFVKSNNLTVAVGDIYMIYLSAFGSSGVNNPYFWDNASSIGLMPAVLSKRVLFMPTVAGTYNIYLGHWYGLLNFSCTGFIYKITTNRSTIGNPLSPYKLNFTEVYEDAGVTTTGATYLTNVKSFVPATGDGTAFTEYVLHDNTSLFANKTLRNNITKSYSSIPYELWVTFFTEYVEIKLGYSKDGGGYNDATHPVCYEGWGVIIFNVGELLATVTSYIAFQITTISDVVISEAMEVGVDPLAIDERTVLEFDGLVGGKEYLAFEGMKDLQFSTIRNYYTGANKNKKPLSFSGVNRQRLETRFKDINNAEYLKSLLLSEDVKKMLPSYVVPADVTILTDTVKIQNSELFTNQIEIEYED